jgi:O-antigen/teichoic acid export membrane protein
MNLDSVVLGLLAGETQVGYYNAGMRLVRTSVAIVTSVGITVIPRITYHYESGGHSEYTGLLGKSFSLICLLSVPAAVLLALGAPGIIGLVFGDRFLPAVPALEIAAALVVITGFTHFLGQQILFPRGDEKRVFYSSLAAAAASLAGNALLARHLHHTGAALSALASECVVLGLQWRWASHRHGQGLLQGRSPVKYLAAALAMSAPLAIVRLSHAPTPVQWAAGFAASGAIYLAVLLALGETHVRDTLGAVRARLRGP